MNKRNHMGNTTTTTSCSASSRNPASASSHSAKHWAATRSHSSIAHAAVGSHRPRPLLLEPESEPKWLRSAMHACHPGGTTARSRACMDTDGVPVRTSESWWIGKGCERGKVWGKRGRRQAATAATHELGSRTLAILQQTLGGLLNRANGCNGRRAYLGDDSGVV